MQRLSPSLWQARRCAHEARIDSLLAGHQERSQRGNKHPVEDFLFTYYSHRPSHLRRWHPGIGIALEIGKESMPEYHSRYYHSITAEQGREATAVDVDAYLQDKADSFAYIHQLLIVTANRQPHFGCFGLHEWAMVYRLKQQEVRHETWPLRLGEDGTDSVVERHRIACSHFDAFRFFTKASRPLNQLQPERATIPQLEQPGCIHATMDLYKWAYKLLPIVSSELVADCFELAKKAREIDMRASPYDLSALGYEPICIETAEGKAQYMDLQRGLAEEGQQLRARIIDICQQLTQDSSYRTVNF